MPRLLIMKKKQHRKDVSIECLAKFHSNKAKEGEGSSICWQGHGISVLGCTWDNFY